MTKVLGKTIPLAVIIDYTPCLMREIGVAASGTKASRRLTSLG